MKPEIPENLKDCGYCKYDRFNRTQKMPCCNCRKSDRFELHPSIESYAQSCYDAGLADGKAIQEQPEHLTPAELDSITEQFPQEIKVQSDLYKEGFNDGLGYKEQPEQPETVDMSLYEQVEDISPCTHKDGDCAFYMSGGKCGLGNTEYYCGFHHCYRLKQQPQ